MIERCDPVSHLYIAVPALTGQIWCPTAQSLLGAVMVAQGFLKIEVSAGFESGNPYLDHARNNLVTRFLASDATDLLFVDWDVGFEPRAVAQICRATRPFVAGLYPKKQDGPTEWPADFAVSECELDAEGLVEARMVPTGFLRLNRAVFDLMPHREYEFAGRKSLGYFESLVGRGGNGEDVEFCAQWRALGGKIHIIPNLTFEHVGAKTWKANWAESHQRPS
jgi:hypothetical protein